MLGFTLPLAVILGMETILAMLLLGPRTTAAPALMLCKSTKSAVGGTVQHTVVGFLLVSLAAPTYDLWRIRADGPRARVADGAAQFSEAEANAWLAAVMILAALLLMAVIKKLGLIMLEAESGHVSQGAMLKQVRGLQSEYQRLLDSSGGFQGAEAATEVKRLKQELAVAEGLREELHQARADMAVAERNAQVLKSQSAGLETEYDRLLAELDESQRRLQRAGGGSRGNNDSMSLKKVD